MKIVYFENIGYFDWLIEQFQMKTSTGMQVEEVLKVLCVMTEAPAGRAVLQQLLSKPVATPVKVTKELKALLADIAGFEPTENKECNNLRQKFKKEYEELHNNTKVF